MPLSALPAFATARFVNGLVSDFGDAAAELDATSLASVVAPLTNFGVLHFAGEDAEAFLHGQLSCEVRSLSAGKSTPGGYCTAQGRLLANFLLWRAEDGFRMLLSRDIAPAIQRRLQMYVLRAKVKIADESEQCIALGASGPQAADALAHAGLAPAPRAYGCATHASGTVLTLPDGRHLALVHVDALEETWTALARTLKPVGQPCWAWLDIAQGLPWITAATQDQLVPQMVNLEALGGVSFQKGCYPGQEVVARTQYRAKTHRRMYRAHSAMQAQAGMALYAASLGDQAAGTVVNAAPAPEGGWELLAVLHPEALEGPIRLGNADGAPIELRELPYRTE